MAIGMVIGSMLTDVDITKRSSELLVRLAPRL
jgi:hypothetical protein